MKNNITKKIVLILLFGIILTILIISLLILNGNLLIINPSVKKYPIRGIDISHHQGKINWEILKTNNLDFVFIKATEGDDFVDKDFINNWENTRNIGLIRGAYHFFSLRIKGSIQADNYIKNVPAEKNSLPPVIDLEYGGNSKKKFTKSEFILEIIDYIEKIENYYKRGPVLYVTYDFYNDYIKDVQALEKYKLWIRSVFFEPRLLDNQWMFWQYSSRGHIKGITGYTDLNVFKFNLKEFKTFCNNK